MLRDKVTWENLQSAPWHLINKAQWIKHLDKYTNVKFFNVLLMQLAFFLSQISSEQVCDPTDVSTIIGGLLCCKGAAPPASAGLFNDISCHFQSWADIQSNHLNLKYLLFFSHWGSFPRWSGKLRDQFCPCCKGIYATRTTSRTRMDYISKQWKEYTFKKTFPLCQTDDRTAWMRGGGCLEGN